LGPPLRGGRFSAAAAPPVAPSARGRDEKRARVFSLSLRERDRPRHARPPRTAAKPRTGAARTLSGAGPRTACRRMNLYSHSMVAGGLDETSYTTRFTPFT